MSKGIRYSDQFRLDAVRLVESGVTQSQVCRDLGVSKSALSTWVKRSRARQAGVTFTGSKDQDANVSELLKRNRELEEEIYIMRRAAAYFAEIERRGPKLFTR